MTAINIGLHLGEQVIDLRIPRDVTVARLREVITDGLATQGIPLPKQFGLRVLNKAMRLDDDVTVRDYPLADGDQLGLEIKSETYDDKEDT